MGISEKMGTILNITELNCEARVGGGQGGFECYLIARGTACFVLMLFNSKGNSMFCADVI